MNTTFKTPWEISSKSFATAFKLCPFIGLPATGVLALLGVKDIDIWFALGAIVISFIVVLAVMFCHFGAENDAISERIAKAAEAAAEAEKRAAAAAVAAALAAAEAKRVTPQARRWRKVHALAMHGATEGERAAAMAAMTRMTMN